MDDPRRPLREFEDRALRLAMGGYDWTLLPLENIKQALGVDGEIVVVRVPGVNGEFVAHRAFVQRLVETRSAIPEVPVHASDDGADGEPRDSDVVD